MSQHLRSSGFICVKTIDNNQHMLIVKNKTTQYWSFPKGKTWDIKSKETKFECACRKFNEETNINIGYRLMKYSQEYERKRLCDKPNPYLEANIKCKKLNNNNYFIINLDEQHNSMNQLFDDIINKKISKYPKDIDEIIFWNINHELKDNMNADLRRYVQEYKQNNTMCYICHFLILPSNIYVRSMIVSSLCENGLKK